jgi:hypothetical protein
MSTQCPSSSAASNLAQQLSNGHLNTSKVNAFKVPLEKLSKQIRATAVDPNAVVFESKNWNLPDPTGNNNNNNMMITKSKGNIKSVENNYPRVIGSYHSDAVDRALMLCAVLAVVILSYLPAKLASCAWWQGYLFFKLAAVVFAHLAGSNANYKVGLPGKPGNNPTATASGNPSASSNPNANNRETSNGQKKDNQGMRGNGNSNPNGNGKTNGTRLNAETSNGKTNGNAINGTTSNGKTNGKTNGTRLNAETSNGKTNGNAINGTTSNGKTNGKTNGTRLNAETSRKTNGNAINGTTSNGKTNAHRDMRATGMTVTLDPTQVNEMRCELKKLIDNARLTSKKRQQNVAKAEGVMQSLDVHIPVHVATAYNILRQRLLDNKKINIQRQW